MVYQICLFFTCLIGLFSKIWKATWYFAHTQLGNCNHWTAFLGYFCSPGRYLIVCFSFLRISVILKHIIATITVCFLVLTSGGYCKSAHFPCMWDFYQGILEPDALISYKINILQKNLSYWVHKQLMPSYEPVLFLCSFSLVHYVVGIILVI